MKKLKVIIERGKDDYGAWIENVSGVYGAGSTVEEAKKSVEDGLKLFIKHNKELPSVLKGQYELVYKFDAQSLFQFYKGIFTKAAIERITGINQRQLQHYSSGLKKPRPNQAKKIETSLHKLGAELLSVEL